MSARTHDNLDSAVGRIVEESTFRIARTDSALSPLIEPVQRGGILRPEVRRTFEDRLRDLLWETFDELTVGELRRYALHLDRGPK